MPTKDQQSNSNRQRIQFAFNAEVGTPIGILFRYLIKPERSHSREQKHKGIDAMSAFWKPFAYQEQGNLTEEELQAIARDAIEALSRQMELISQTFGVERPSSIAPASQLKDEVRQAVREALQELGGSEAIASSPQPPPSGVASLPAIAKPNPTEVEGIDFDEDVLLGDLFENADIAA
jgi:hypothetical protein